jgi:O-antigen ligase
MLGGFMAAGLIIVLFLWLRDKSLFTKWLLLGMTILFSGTLVITFSRGAWLSLVISLVVFLFFFLISRAKKLTRKSLGLIGLMLITCAMTAMLFWNPFTTRFHPAERLEAQSLVERQDQYHEFGQLFRSSPIFGVGPGAYAVALEDQYPGDEPWRYQPVHNAILLVLAELGFVGGILFFVLVQILDLRNYKAWNSLEGVFGMSLGTALLIPALLDHYVWSSWSGLILSAFVLAMIYQAAENGLSKGKIELK